MIINKISNIKKVILYIGAMIIIFTPCCTICEGCVKNLAPTPKPVIDDKTNPECVPMCDNLIDLGCPAGLGSPGVDEVYGTSDDLDCYETCTITQEQLEEVLSSLPIKCITEAKSCGAVRECK
jgi:hypothetical protein